MSTKINARSPFYLEAEEPTISLGAFTCTTAGLANFSVASNGVITDPTILKGTILSKDQNTPFAENTSGSSISRTVNYTIIIPSGYTNAGDTTIVCPQTFSQPSQTAQDNPVSNDNCPTFSNSISNITGLDSSGSTVSLGSFFTSGADADINEYTLVRQSGQQDAITGTITGTVPNQTLTFTTGQTCTSATFVVQARNNADGCKATSNSFTVTANCPSVTLTCTTDNATNDAINLQGGSITADGTINNPSWNGGTGILAIKRIEDSNGNTITSYPSNSTASARDVVLTFVFDIPSHYSNSGEIECDKTFTQPTTVAPLETLECGDDRIVYQGFRIATTGDIVEGGAQVLVDGVSASFTVNTLGVGTGTLFPEVETETPRTVGIAITVPAGFANSGSVIGGTSGSACNQTIRQPRSTNPCTFVTGVYYITVQGFNQFCDICDGRFVAGLNITGSPQLNENACRNGNPFNGGNKWFGVGLTQDTLVGDIGTTFEAIRISEFGIVTDRAQVNCTSGPCIGGISDLF